MLIVACTVGSPALAVMKASVEAYAPEHELRVRQGTEGNFGDDYNLAISEAFADHDEIIVSNDDVVLTPDTMRILLEDVERLKQTEKLGFVATRADAIRPAQNICNNDGSQILAVYTVSPVFAWLSKEAFKQAQFPPINWYGDDVMCLDLHTAGFRNFVSRAYVHHAGSTTIGHDNQKNHDAAAPWVRKHRPDYARQLFNS
jgi:GT2 family glycosyltransferase